MDRENGLPSSPNPDEMNIQDSVVQADQIGDNVTIVNNYFSQENQSLENKGTQNQSGLRTQQNAQPQNQFGDCNYCNTGYSSSRKCSLLHCDNPICDACNIKLVEKNEDYCHLHNNLDAKIKKLNNLMERDGSNIVRSYAMKKYEISKGNHEAGLGFFFIILVILLVGYLYYQFSPLTGWVSIGVSIVVYPFLGFIILVGLMMIGEGSTSKSIMESWEASGKIDPNRTFKVIQFDVHSKVKFGAKEDYIGGINLGQELVYYSKEVDKNGEPYNFYRSGTAFEDFACSNSVESD
jgi:hypothetical protein